MYAIYVVRMNKIDTTFAFHCFLLLGNFLVLQILGNVKENNLKKILNKDHKMQVMAPHNVCLL